MHRGTVVLPVALLRRPRPLALLLLDRVLAVRELLERLEHALPAQPRRALLEGARLRVVMAECDVASQQTLIRSCARSMVAGKTDGHISGAATAHGHQADMRMCQKDLM